MQKCFMRTAYRAAVEIVGGEQYILSAVMHADERNRAMSEALGEDIYHYHLHVVYVPVVEKKILWTKRCKDKSLVGTVKETIMQVSSSKKWTSKPAFDESGNIILQKNGKPVLKKSYSVLQDDFFDAMKKAGYTDVERGERGSTEEHLTVTQFKVIKEQERLSELEAKTEKQERIFNKAKQKTQVQNKIAITFSEIDNMGSKTLFSGKVQLTQNEAMNLKELAKKGVTAKAKISDLEQKLENARRDADIWKNRYEKLKEQTKDFIKATLKAPELVMELIKNVLSSDVNKNQPSTRDKNKDIER